MLIDEMTCGSLLLVAGFYPHSIEFYQNILQHLSHWDFLAFASEL